MKAVLIDRQVNFPKTHSIKLLIELLPVNIERTAALIDAVSLTEYATVFRYPGEIEPITEEEYHHLLAVASDVIRWAEAMINRWSDDYESAHPDRSTPD